VSTGTLGTRADLATPTATLELPTSLAYRFETFVTTSYRCLVRLPGVTDITPAMMISTALGSLCRCSWSFQLSGLSAIPGSSHADNILHLICFSLRFYLKSFHLRIFYSSPFEGFLYNTKPNTKVNRIRKMLFRVSILAAALLASVTVSHVEAELSSANAQTSVSSQEFVETKDTRIRLTALLLSKWISPY